MTNDESSLAELCRIYEEEKIYADKRYSGIVRTSSGWILDNVFSPYSEEWYLLTGDSNASRGRIYMESKWLWFERWVWIVLRTPSGGTTTQQIGTARSRAGAMSEIETRLGMHEAGKDEKND